MDFPVRNVGLQENGGDRNVREEFNKSLVGVKLYC